MRGFERHRLESPASATLTLPPEALEQIARRAAELVVERIRDEKLADDGWLRGARAIAAYIAAPRSRVYQLAHMVPPRIPIHRDGSVLMARKSELDEWIEAGGGRRR